MAHPELSGVADLRGVGLDPAPAHNMRAGDPALADLGAAHSDPALGKIEDLGLALDEERLLAFEVPVEVFPREVVDRTHGSPWGLLRWCDIAAAITSQHRFQARSFRALSPLTRAPSYTHAALIISTV